jgi:plasmid stabilization system protein ParE
MKTLFRLIVKEEAAAEIRDAFDYYEEQQFGLGEYFLGTLYNRFQTLLTNPQANPKIHDEYRQAVVPKFPFVIIYEIENEAVVVYSVFHTSRHPDGKIK